MLNKLAAKKAVNSDNAAYVDPKLIRLESKESNKVSSVNKGAIACIDWSIDGSKIVVCFKQHNQIVVWDVQSTQRVIQIDFSVLGRGPNQDMPAAATGNMAL